MIVTGVGMKFAEGVAAGKAGSMEATVGTALPAVVLICVSVAAPLALFKLLAFVDPGTASGAAMRAGMAGRRRRPGLVERQPVARPPPRRLPLPGQRRWWRSLGG